MLKINTKILKKSYLKDGGAMAVKVELVRTSYLTWRSKFVMNRKSSGSKHTGRFL